MTGDTTLLAPALAALRDDRLAGEIAARTDFAPGLALHADPALQVTGSWRSPAGRLLELDLHMAGTGRWIGLHLRLETPDLSRAAWLGFACRGAAAQETLIRPCLRSGSDKGFSDCFFGRHLLAAPEVRDHVDALHVPTHRNIPETAGWRELVLFLPQQDFRWHLHDLRLFLT